MHNCYFNFRAFLLIIFLSLTLGLTGSCNKIQKAKSGEPTYGAFTVGVLSGILRAVSPAKPGSTGIVQNPMPINPIALVVWLNDPAGECPHVDADFYPVPPTVVPPVPLKPAQCRSISSDGSGTSEMNSSGAALWRIFDLCQYDNMDLSPWIKSEFLMRFDSPADCNSFQTDATLASGKKVVLTYGNGQHGDQQNRFFSANGEVQYVYTDFPSGWNELKSGGVEVVFGAGDKPSQISILGIQVKNFQQGLRTLSPRKLFVVLEQNGVSGLNLADDVTLSTLSPLIVNYSGNIPTVSAGQILSQDGTSGALLNTQVASPLVFADLNCCWPTSGSLSTTAISSRAFSETITFTPTCGQAELTRSRGNRESTREPLTLQYCF